MTNEENKVRVVVTYTAEMEKPEIKIDDLRARDTDGMKNKSISEWFSPSKDRKSWKGFLNFIVENSEHGAVFAFLVKRRPTSSLDKGSHMSIFSSLAPLYKCEKNSFSSSSEP